VLTEVADESGWALQLDMSRAQAERLAADDPWFASQMQAHLKLPLEAWEQGAEEDEAVLGRVGS
jgi:hypothetical protein